jgi:hypothetical protein
MTTSSDNAAICHWLTPTRLMPHPYFMEAGEKPWSCLRDGCPRPLTGAELRDCAACPRLEARSYDDTKRDLVYETWGVGILIPERGTFEEMRRGIVAETWGVASD